ncbi:MAG TPA: GntR family transcriptional regulator, partial [Thermomicrobiales bacterium]|nr:GntR family transcriptional regulator [Thermomicrobiales bacterium]
WRLQGVTGATSDMVHQVLHEAIVRSLLPAAQRLGEVQLASLFEVSRTPVREALLRLEAERLAERVPRRGLVVRGITPKEIVDLYVLREAIDGLAASLAAASATPADLAQLTMLSDRFTRAAAAGDSAALAEINLHFHEAIAHTSQNALLIEFVLLIHRSVRRFPTTTFSHPGRAREAADAHRALVDAIAAGDGARARQIAEADMFKAREIRVAMLLHESERPPNGAR